MTNVLTSASVKAAMRALQEAMAQAVTDLQTEAAPTHEQALKDIREAYPSTRFECISTPEDIDAGVLRLIWAVPLSVVRVPAAPTVRATFEDSQ